jgi:hypothetical protein
MVKVMPWLRNEELSKTAESDLRAFTDDEQLRNILHKVEGAMKVSCL